MGENREEIIKALGKLNELLGKEKHLELKVKAYADGRIEGEVMRENTPEAISAHLESSTGENVLACCKETYKIEHM